ncbi:MAG TPA: hypothetical protein VEQ59_10830, partial [Polyangiaceae bacterium]|nr:hypothetical protein [Polyangiaceae bacterium]
GAPSPSLEAAPPATVAPIDTGLAPAPDLAIPPVSASDVKALLDAPTTVTHGLVPRGGGKRPPPATTPTSKKTSEPEPPAPPPPAPPPPATADAKRHRDFGY